ncbi:MAG: class I fructose-bisphosphate aldolase [Candidatus Microgenomates bacterium]|jgi:fructose-bisphosphate aldolase class I
MEDLINKILAPGKGLLAADESTHTIEKRFESIGLTSTPELNRKYRQMFFTTPGIEQFLSGIILFDETTRQKTDDGVSFPAFLTQKGIIPGIKVDGGLEPFNGGEEQITKGLEGLGDRLKEYFKMGLKFTKWRAAIKISDIFPTDAFLEEDLGRITEFAKISQENGFIPIVEPEILLDGNHTTTRCAEIEMKVLKLLFDKLKSREVDLTKLLLKTSMVLPGKESGVKAEPLEVAHATLRTLKTSVPADVPGIVFLSGGQTPDEATKNLNEIVKLKDDAPWQLSFSFARALQEEAMAEWDGKDENVRVAQQAFLSRLERVSQARNGKL